MYSIEEGDKVDVSISDGAGMFQNLEVLYTPSAPGDCWIFKEQDGSTLYVQQYLYIRKH
jgi:hypothetical protein